ncbi:MAG: hypothetical protein HC901_01885 [Bdellovibrionaceae bacterium]|nr:hypothetical protein [Pseudobdellovibrionaceae bacterium]
MQKRFLCVVEGSAPEELNAGELLARHLARSLPEGARIIDRQTGTQFPAGALESMEDLWRGVRMRRRVTTTHIPDVD